MASDLNFVQFIADQIEPAETVTYRKMFGEYALYYQGKVVALICNNQLFVKPTDAGRNVIGDVDEAPAYPGGRPWFLIGDKIEDRDWISSLLELTWRELPEPKPKKKPARRKVRKLY